MYGCFVERMYVQVREWGVVVSEEKEKKGGGDKEVGLLEEGGKCEQV